MSGNIPARWEPAQIYFAVRTVIQNRSQFCQSPWGQVIGRTGLNGIRPGRFLDTIPLVKTRSSQARILILAGLALLALFALAATLNALEFDPGGTMPFFDFGSPVADMNVQEEWQRVALIILRVAMIVTWLLLPFGVLLLIIDKCFRKRFLRDLMFLLPLFAALYVFYNARRKMEGAPEEMLGESFRMDDLQQGLQDPSTAPVYTPPDPVVTNLITTLIAVLIALAVIGVVWALVRRSRLQRQAEPLRRIEKEAQSALDDIQAGGDLRDAIIRAYMQMMQAVSQYRNIQRDQHVTPHEFERSLTERGLPRQPVHQLTELFEQVRYGGARPGWAEERAAVASLSAIVSACQRERAEER